MLFLVVVAAIFNLVVGKEVTCEELVSPEHGSLHLLGDRKVDSLALFSCDDGWKLVGASATKCHKTGQWTSSPPRCIEKGSSNPPTPTVRVATPAPAPSPPPERKATPEVIKTHDTRGSPLTPEHTEEDECSCTYNSQDRTLSAKVNGLRLRYGDKVKKGDKMTIRCYDQAKHLVLPNDTSISGTLNLTCNACQIWTDAVLPSCGDVRSEITCRKLDETELMTISYTDNLSVGSIANFHCFAPGIQSGVSQTQCLQTGEWSHFPPTCKNICLLPMVIGTCYGKVLSWYFNSDSKTCEIFTYSGCLGNSNRFATKADCETKCINQQAFSCKDSKYGCCPDGKTSAGLNYEGCDKVNISSTNVSCEKTEFGCCSDGFTLALGPFKKGCPSILKCNKTKFDCCPDAETIAKGLNTEGCPEENNCTNSTHSCCLDGRTETTGLEVEGCLEKIDCSNATFSCCSDEMRAATCPNLEGCETSLDNKGCKNVTDCTSSEFGCCLDNMTAALGSNLEGCNETVTDKSPESTTELVATCTNTSFGCCPDDITTALGPNLEGCCFGFRFGCCPDNKTAALGPSYRGCGCLTYPYGCCPDGINAAQGINYQGCQCEQFRYGCCQDNVTPAKGPNFEGCTCQFTQYGCCPDGRTPILNERGEGCGCDSTRYGCCPDGKTAATSADLSGCPCDTLSYGCCPDGHTPARTSDLRDCPCEAHRYGCCLDGRTIARGPEYEGCPCDSTRFGCCMDGKTTAQGPDFAGCPCHTTRYGCCADGNTPASGLHYKGCPDVQRPKPPVPTEVCSLPKEAGPCRNFTVKWFFDVGYGGCSRFWYGGCDGNGNVFANLEDCEKLCVRPEGSEMCLLPKVTGSCNGKVPSWYFDAGSRKCETFTYGGCLGNNNRFLSKTDCEAQCINDDDICRLPRDIGLCDKFQWRWYFHYESRKCLRFIYSGCDGNANNFASNPECEERCGHDTVSEPFTELEFKTDDDDICRLPHDIGPCNEFRERWYFDYESTQCHRFIYGGCDGNANNFASYPECERKCGQETDSESPTDEFDTKYCFLPQDSGPCSSSEVNWFYDSTDGVCKDFYYGGCKGNRNRFKTRKECETSCFKAQDMCNLAPVKGSCSGSFILWYYDPNHDDCLEFTFGGCQGNANRFDSKERCQQRCKKVPVTTEPPQTSSDICSQSQDPGSCLGYYRYWYYDGSDNACKSFVYGGCEGNDNRFEDRRDCEQRCVRKTPKVPVTTVPETSKSANEDICSQPKEPGPCLGYYRHWYYDSSNNACKSFVYGGCEGNDNRFENRRNCEQQCITNTSKVPVTNTSETLTSRIEVPVSTAVNLITSNPTTGSPLQVDCVAEGPPEAKVTWQFGDDQIFVDDRKTIFPNHTLYITEADISDSGEYKCTAQFNSNVATSSVYVTVRAKPADSDCIDDPRFSNCNVIVDANYCNHKYYGKFCCASCMKAGQLQDIPTV